MAAQRSILLPREQFLKDIAIIDRRYIYQLFYTLVYSPSNSDILEATWQLIYALDRKRDAELGRSKKLLDQQSEYEFPLMRSIYNACFGDYYLINNRQFESEATFFLSYRLPEVIYQYLDIDPITGEYTKNYNKEILKIEGISPFEDLLGSIGSFLGVDPDSEDDSYSWANFDTVEEFKSALNNRKLRDSYLTRYYGIKDNYIETANEHYAKESFFNFADPELRDEITDMLESEFHQSTDPYMYLEAFDEFRSMINKPYRLLLIGPDPGELQDPEGITLPSQITTLIIDPDDI